MINLGKLVAAGQDVLELAVHDLAEALAFYDAEPLAIRVDDDTPAAHILMDGTYVVLREMPRS